MSSIDKQAKPVKMVGAVTQAFRILRLLSGNSGPQGVSAIAKHSQVNPSTAFNILRTLVAEDAVNFDELSKTYVLGPGLLALCGKLLEQSIVQAIRGDLDRLATATNCLIGLWQIDDGRMTLVERSVAGRAIRLDMDIKQRLPRFGGAVGRAWAAALKLSDAELRDGFAALRWEGRITGRAYIKEVREAEQFGYAIDDEALYRGVVSVGTVITDRQGVPIFGLTSSDIAHNLDAAKIKRLGEEMASLSRAFSPANRANKIDAEGK